LGEPGGRTQRPDSFREGCSAGWNAAANKTWEPPSITGGRNRPVSVNSGRAK
jgi:hypothetical protein